ncbi:MAG TPA: AAA family ATPase [Gaiellaceae bacterium]
MAACGVCGQENPAEARFCLACGSPLAGTGLREVRKTVTVLFADLAGSTGLGERLDPESLRGVQTRYFEEGRAVLERHGGTVEKFIGDAVVAVFGVPVVHEDDALRAVRAAVELRDAIARLSEELSSTLGVSLALRIGVNTGQVVAGGGRSSFATGDAVNVAARLEQAAEAGEILIGGTTLALVRHAVEVEDASVLELRGRDEPAAAHRLVAVRPAAEAVSRSQTAELIGREAELRMLESAFERVERERSCHLFTILGAAGVGKSRLVEEFVEGLGDRARSVAGRCLPYGEGITFWPLTEIVKSAAGLGGGESPEEARALLAELVAGEEDAELVAARVAELVGLSGEKGEGEESFWAARKLFEALARERPLVVVLDDVNWAETTFLDLVEHIADWVRGAPLLVLCLARPELLDDRPGWARGMRNASSMVLDPLNAGEAERLIAGRLGSDSVDREIAKRVTEVAEGNPLFVEEMLAMLVGEGLVQRENGGWTAAADLSRAPVPLTIQALLAARIDRLDPGERTVLERAAVEGKVFHRGAVRALASEVDADSGLSSLVRKELLLPDRSSLPGEDAFRFRHILIRDAAYESMPKEARSGLHEAYASWLVETAGDRALEYEEIVAYHLERAFRLREELGRLGEESEALAAAAAARLASAGLRAEARDDSHGAATLLGRAVALLPEDDPMRIGLLVPLARARIELLKLDEADALMTESARRASRIGDRSLEHRALVEKQLVRLKTDPEGSTEDARTVAEQALEVFAELGDEAGLATAWDLLANIHLMACRYEERAAALEEALVHARNVGDARASELLISLETAHYWGPTPVEECVARWERLLAAGLVRGPTLEAALAGTLAGLEAMRGRFDEARTLYARQRAIHEDLGREYTLASWTMVSARIELLAGDLAAAEAELRRGYETLERMQEFGVLSTLSAYLADVLYAQERYEEADHYTRVSEDAASPDDIASQVWWRVTRAKVAARDGDPDAEHVAREAVALAEPTDDLALRARSVLDLAEVLRLLGREEESRPLVEESIALSERKGDVVSAERARGLLAELPA